jgi:soluble lytic murein transglycosylase-like protein
MAESRTRREKAGLASHGKGEFPVGGGRVCRRLPFVLRLALVVALLVLWVGNAPASIYLCRDRGGKSHFTNVPAGDCQSYSLQEPGGAVRKGSSHPGRIIAPSAYDAEIRRVGRRFNVDPPLIKAIIHAESAFNHRAVSRRGAQGLMQLMPDTARELRVRDPFDPLDNIEGGTRYMRFLLDSFNNDLVLSLAAYNAGPGMVQRSGGVPRIPETRRYVNKVLKHYKSYKASW